MLNRFCITDPCTIEPVPKWFCITDSCTIEPVPNRLCRTDSCIIEPVLNRSCITVSCTTEPVHNRFRITDSCTIKPVLNRAVSNRYGAQLFSCTIGPCSIGRAESEPCKIVLCLIDTIPLSYRRSFVLVTVIQYGKLPPIISLWGIVIQRQCPLKARYTVNVSFWAR